MNEETATRLMKEALNLDKALGALDAAVSALPDEAERKLYAQKLGEIFRDVNELFIEPLAKEFPSLDPHK